MITLCQMDSKQCFVKSAQSVSNLAKLVCILLHFARGFSFERLARWHSLPVLSIVLLIGSSPCRRIPLRHTALHLLAGVASLALPTAPARIIYDTSRCRSVTALPTSHSPGHAWRGTRQEALVQLHGMDRPLSVCSNWQ